MSQPEIPADLRDHRATDRDQAAEQRDGVAHVRDDAAEQRDGIAHGRDDAADQRDVEAAERDADFRDSSDDLTERIRLICQQILNRTTRIENATIDPADWPDLTPAALAHLDAYTAEQRRLARLDREAVTALLDQLHYELSRFRDGRRSAARNRVAAARDRQHSAGNRDDAGQDRDRSARDRGQAAIEREQVDPRDLPPGRRRHSTPPVAGPRTSRDEQI